AFPRRSSRLIEAQLSSTNSTSVGVSVAAGTAWANAGLGLSTQAVNQTAASRARQSGRRPGFTDRRYQRPSYAVNATRRISSRTLGAVAVGPVVDCGVDRS